MMTRLSRWFGVVLAVVLALGCNGSGSGKGGTGGMAGGGAGGAFRGTGGQPMTDGSTGAVGTGGASGAATGGTSAGVSGTGGMVSTGGATGTDAGGGAGSDSSADGGRDGGTVSPTDTTGDKSAAEAATPQGSVEVGPHVDVLDAPRSQDLSDGGSAIDSLDGSPIMATETRTIVEFSIPPVGIYLSLPMFIATGADGNMWFTNSNRNSVSRITPDGMITEFAIPTGGYSTKSSGPGDLVPGPDGNLWFPESAAGKIASITPQGVITELAIPAPGSIGYNMVFGPDGAIWFPESKDSIGRITLAGTLTEYAVPLVPNPNWTTEQPEAIVIGPDGNVWFTDAGGGDIARMSLAGTITQFRLPTRGLGPGSIAIGGDGNLWFGEEAYHLGRITPSGLITELQLPIGDQPGRFATAPDGNLWLKVGVGNAGDIVRISRDGVLTKFLISTDNAGPMDLAVGPDGKIWFTQWATDQIGYFEP